MSRPLTFDRFQRATAGPLAPDRPYFFDLLQAEDQDACWRDLAEACERHNERLRNLDPLDHSLRSFAGVDAEKRAAKFAPRKRSVSEKGAPIGAPFSAGRGADRLRPRHLAVVPDEDVLRLVSPPEYIAALIEEEVPPSGMVRCPFHEDRTPSLRAYADASAGWYCFSCAAGGSIYDFGAALFELGTRGSDFIELRRRLAAALLGREAA